jgi:prepilin-type N-terminal cleavage/methylation domain-containing protein
MSKKLPIFKYQFGFNLVELLVALSIMGILFGLGYANYRDFSRRQVLTNVAKNIQADLRMAQAIALAGQKPAGCGVLDGYLFNIITTTNYQIVARCNGVASSIEKDVNLTNGVTITNTLPFSILFRVLGNGTDISTANKTINLIQTGTAGTATITITKGGQIQ